MRMDHKPFLWQLRFLATLADAPESSSPMKGENALKCRKSRTNCVNPLYLFMLENVLISHKRFPIVNTFIFNHPT